MANNVIGQVAGGSKQVIDGLRSVGEVSEKLGVGVGYSAFLNGEAASSEDELKDGDMVTFSKAVKGGTK